MKLNIIFLLIVLVIAVPLNAQNSIENVLQKVEKNNSTLAAIRKSIDAEKIGNKTDIFLQNPEVGFNYLWGNPTLLGNRTDVSISQSFDFPTVYLYKNQISTLKNEQAELEYQKQLRDLILQTNLLCVNLIYFNALKLELSHRFIHAQSIADAYTKKYKLGDSNILEYNKAQLNLLNTSHKLKNIEIEKTALLSELATLNGGISIDFEMNEFDIRVVPDNFESWYAEAEMNNPILSWLKQEVEINITREKLSRALSYPKFLAGYMSEKVVGEKFQGVTVGLAIPLWENKNKVKLAEAQTQALQGIETDNKIQFYNRLKTLYEKAVSLQKNIADYRLGIQNINNSELLKKALDQGEITLIEYMLELSVYYESINNLLELEKETMSTIARLNQYL